MPATLKFQDIEVPVPGYGAMSLAHADATEEKSLEVLKTVYDAGCRFWDTAAVYAFGGNEKLLGRFFKENGVGEDVFLASKCGFDIDYDKGENRGVTNSPEHIRATLALSTERLGRKPDLYYLHRIDPDTPLQDSIKALQECKEKGLTRYIGLSEPGVETLRKASEIAHIDAIQIEFSPFFTAHLASGLIPLARQLGTAIVAYSPLGRGLLTGQYRDASHFARDRRATMPKLQGANLAHNLKLVDAFVDIAQDKGCTPGQLALAWVVRQGCIPIPGTKDTGRFQENWAAREVQVSDAEDERVWEVIRTYETVGDRYAPEDMSKVGK